MEQVSKLPHMHFWDSLRHSTTFEVMMAGYNGAMYDGAKV